MNTGNLNANRRAASLLAIGDCVQWFGMDAVVTEIYSRHGRVHLTLVDSTARIMHKSMDARTRLVIR